jgi:trans-2,3-dihydro-3-hydroxyanthranilate isomerase
MMPRRFVTLDVFTARRFAGNPLAVVLDAEGLDTSAMQTIAREFNLSETVFVLPPEDPAHRAKLRIFTPATELPFAGHPTVGSAVLLGRLDGGAGEGEREIVLEENIGLVRCLVATRDARSGRARFALARLPQEIGAADAGAAAAALGLAPGDIGFDRFLPGRWTAGVNMTMVPVKGLDAVGRSTPDLARWDAAFPAEASAAFVFCRDTVEPGHAFHARMFGPRLGIPEDPATGAAVAAFAGVLSHQAGLADGDHALVIEQGFEMGRPSLIHLGLTLRAGALVAATIGGEAIVVTEGTIAA